MTAKRIAPRVPWSAQDGLDLKTAHRLEFEGADELVLDPPESLDLPDVAAAVRQAAHSLDIPLVIWWRRGGVPWAEKILAEGAARLLAAVEEAQLGRVAQAWGAPRISAYWVDWRPSELEGNLWRLRDLGVGEAVLDGAALAQGDDAEWSSLLGHPPLNLGIWVEPSLLVHATRFAEMADALYLASTGEVPLWQPHGIKARLDEAGLGVRR